MDESTKDPNEYNKNPKNYNPEMHSAEHILNRTMVHLFDCGRAFSAHIEKKKSKCDYHFGRNLTPEEIQQVEKKVNEVIQSDAPVKESFLTRSEAAGRFNLTRLPEESGETIRVITIGDYDECPCSGIHVSSTREIGSVKIVSTDWNEGVLRVRFKRQ
jgi:Ser-tRNA(Ala) deacylase AlaX